MEQYRSYVERWKPVFVAHEDDKYRPLSFSTYVEGCSLVDRKKKKTLVEYPNLTVDKIIDPDIDPRLNKFDEPTRDIRLEMHKDSPAKFGEPAGSEVELYVYINELTYNGEDYIDIIYNLFYGYNEAGSHSHYYDSEFVTLRVKLDESAAESSLQRMFFSAHGAGGWYSKSNLTLNEAGHPFVYLAIGSHSTWPTKGTHVRMLGFGNDHCTTLPDDEQVIIKTKLVLLPISFQRPFPAVDWEHMAFVGSMSQDTNAFITAHHENVNNPLIYRPYKALEVSGAFLTKQVGFDIKSYITWLLIGSIAVVCILGYLVVNKRNQMKARYLYILEVLIVLFSLLVGFSGAMHGLFAGIKV